MGPTCFRPRPALNCALSLLLLLTAQRTLAQCPRHTKAYQQRLASAYPGASEGKLAFRHAERSLLQDSSCALQIGSSIRQYKACKSYASDLSNQAKVDYFLYWSVLDNNNGTSTLDGGVDAIQQGWAGFGIPSNPGNMLGGSALITKTCSTCASGASVDSYYLGGYAPAAVTPPGKLTVLSMSAAGTGSSLQTTFRLLITASGSDLANFNVIFALGPLAQDGSLMQHRLSQGNAEVIDLTPGLVDTLPDPEAAVTPGPTPAAASTAPAATPGPTPTAAPARAPVATPSPAVQPSPAAATASPPLALGSALTSGGAATSVNSASGGSASVSAVAPAPQGGNGTCSLAFNNQELSFKSCQSLALPSGARVLWTVTEDPAGNGTLMTGALDSTSTGWQGFGFPATAGEMVGGKAIIVKSCASCASGASVAAYSLDGQTPNTIHQRSDALNMTSASAAKANGRLTATFTLRMPQTLDVLNSPMNIIAAVGPLGSGESIQEHDASGQTAGQINFGSGAVTVSTAVDRKPKIHGWLMAVSWGTLIPVGVLVARYMRNLDPWWFHLHRAIQLTGVIAGLAGMGVGIALGEPKGTTIELAHRVCGFIVNGLGVLQVLAIILRPNPNAPIRRYWNWYHWWTGRTAVALAIANMYTGLRTSGERLAFYWAYTGVISAVLVLAVILEIVVKWRPWSSKGGYYTGARVNDEERQPKVPSPKEEQFITSSNGQAEALANGDNGAQFMTSNGHADGVNGAR